MPIEAENALVEELAALRKQVEDAIQRIVDARVKGARDDEAIRQLSALAKREVELTRPVFADAA
jgi:FixJ family two-component response regulator